MNETGRFAPSPTGELHLGNLRTALLAWLFARSRDGRFLVRLEDLDASRVRPGVAESQLGDLRALGLGWDGEVVRQSERTDLYKTALRRLRAAGLIYPCYCTRAEVRAEVAASASAPHDGSGGFAYPGTCRNLTRTRRAEREAAGRRPTLRLNAHDAPGETAVAFQDELLGEVEGFVDDFVVRRGDGSYSYQLAVAVDDAEQDVTQVVRGADLAFSTPRQIFLLKLLGLPVPRYAHVPLVLGPGGERLAKRDGPVGLKDHLKLGRTPEDILRRMARSLGLPVTDGDRLPGGLLKNFTPARLPTQPTTCTALA